MPLNPSIKVMVVDDTLTVRKVIYNSLKSFGFTNIYETNDGINAWSMILHAADENNPFKLIICDWKMPKMNGAELLKKIRDHEKTKDLFFLMVTAETEEQNVMKIMKLGVNDFIVKPFTRETIRTKIEKILSHSF